MSAGAWARARRLAWVVLVAVGPWWCGPMYEGEAHPFSGDSWRNPYAALPEGEWLKVNLHTHTRAWGGVTSGEATADELRQAYEAAGFDALGLSNYFELVPPATDAGRLVEVPVYEHGLNLSKSHRLVIGPRDGVEYVDAPWLTHGMKQLVLNVLSASAEAVAVTHPNMRDGHSCRDLAQLSGYALVEIHNPYATSLAEWDCALSAGRLVWGLGGDDVHHAKPDYVGQAWTMVHAQRSAPAIIAALNRGASFVVRGEHATLENGLRSLHIEGEVLTLELERPSSHVVLTGQGGAVVFEAHDVSQVSYPLKPTDTYVRASVRTPAGELNFNPVYRPVTAEPTQLAWSSMAVRGAVWLALFAAVAWPRRGR